MADAKRTLIWHRVAGSHALREEYIGFQVIDDGVSNRFLLRLLQQSQSFKDTSDWSTW